MTDLPPPPLPPPTAAPRRRLSLKRRLQFLGVALLLGALLAEGVLRLCGFPRGLIDSTAKLWAEPDERALGPFVPGGRATVAYPPELAYTVITNGLGLRGAAPRPAHAAAPAPRPIVLCVGDSTTFGQNVQEDETYPALLQGLLGDGVSVVNGGVPRWTITDQNEFLHGALPTLRPRAVVLLFCGNDLGELDKAPASQRALDGRSPLSGLARSLALPEFMLWAGIGLRRAYLEARGRWPQPLREDQGRTATGDEAWARAHWARYADELARTVGLARAHGCELWVAAFPGYLELEGAPCEIEVTLPTIARAAGARYLDLYAPFRASPAGRFLLPHDAHASRSGNELIAREVAAALGRSAR